MKKNTAALVFAIVGAILGTIGAIMWATCAETCAGIVGSSTGYTIGFIALGIGGAVVSLIGGVQAFGFKKAGGGLSAFGLVLQIGNLILQCVFAGGFSFTLSACTLLSIVLLLLGTVFAFKKS